MDRPDDPGRLVRGEVDGLVERRPPSVHPAQDPHDRPVRTLGVRGDDATRIARGEFDRGAGGGRPRRGGPTSRRSRGGARGGCFRILSSARASISSGGIAWTKASAAVRSHPATTGSSITSRSSTISTLEIPHRPSASMCSAVRTVPSSRRTWPVPLKTGRARISPSAPSSKGTGRAIIADRILSLYIANEGLASTGSPLGTPCATVRAL